MEICPGGDVSASLQQNIPDGGDFKVRISNNRWRFVLVEMPARLRGIRSLLNSHCPTAAIFKCRFYHSRMLFVYYCLESLNHTDHVLYKSNLYNCTVYTFSAVDPCTEYAD